VDTTCRAGPTSEYAILDTLKAGEVLNIQGRSRSGDAWVVLNPHLQDTCWVGGMWVDVTGALSQVEIIDPDPPEAPTATVKVDTTCRSGPTVEYAILDYLKPGTVLNIVSRNRAGDSWMVENPNIGRTCWIAGVRVEVAGAVSQVQIIDPDPPPTPTPEAAHGGQAPSVNCSQSNSNTCNSNPACTWEGGTCKNK